MVAEQCVVCQPVFVGTLVAARWKTWALVVTSSGFVDTRILVTYFDRRVHTNMEGVHEYGRGNDESPAAVGGSTGCKRSSERERERKRVRQRESVRVREREASPDCWITLAFQV